MKQVTQLLSPMKNATQKLSAMKKGYASVISNEHGYIISDESGEVSTLVKLIRVACLVPVVIAISLIMRRDHTPASGNAPLLPWFLVAFIVLVIVNSMGWVPVQAQDALTPVSSWCLLTAVAALGVKTSLKALADVGPAPITVMVLQTLFLAASVIVGITLIR